MSIHRNCVILNFQNIEIGDNVSIHPQCYIDGYGGIIIGNDVSIAHNTTILSSTHSYDNHEVAIKDQPIIKKRTIIGNNVWIGAKVTILSGIIVEDNTIIGASSVVTKNFPGNTIVAGNPAKIIKPLR